MPVPTAMESINTKKQVASGIVIYLSLSSQSQELSSHDICKIGLSYKDHRQGPHITEYHWAVDCQSSNPHHLISLFLLHRSHEYHPPQLSPCLVQKQIYPNPEGHLQHLHDYVMNHLDVLGNPGTDDLAFYIYNIFLEHPQDLLDLRELMLLQKTKG